MTLTPIRKAQAKIMLGAAARFLLATLLIALGTKIFPQSQSVPVTILAIVASLIGGEIIFYFIVPDALRHLEPVAPNQVAPRRLSQLDSATAARLNRARTLGIFVGVALFLATQTPYLIQLWQQ